MFFCVQLQGRPGVVGKGKGSVEIVMGNPGVSQGYLCQKERKWHNEEDLPSSPCQKKRSNMTRRNGPSLLH